MSTLDDMPPRQLPVNESGSIKLLQLRYQERLAVTLRSEKYEDIERAVRKLFKIEEDIAIVISADIESFDNARMEVDPDVWSIIGGEVSVAWVTKQGESVPCPNPRPTAETTSEPLSELDPNARSIECYLYDTSGNWLEDPISSQPIVVIHKDASFHDIKLAICRMNPHLHVQGLHIVQKHLTASGHRHTDTCKAPNDPSDPCSFYYNAQCAPTS